MVITFTLMGKDWRWSSSGGNDPKLKFKKDQIKLESETWARFYIAFLLAYSDII